VKRKPRINLPMKIIAGICLRQAIANELLLILMGALFILFGAVYSYLSRRRSSGSRILDRSIRLYFRDHAYRAGI